MSRPGWVARARARRGVKHPRRGVAIGYRSGFAQVSLTSRELGHHGAIFGAPGSGKTTLLNVIVQGHSRIGPCVVIDCKGEESMQEAVMAAGGLVWTIGGRRKLDLLDPDPTVLAEQLTEAARHEGPAEVFGEAAARAIQWIGHILRWEGVNPTLQTVEALLEPTALAASLKRHQRRPRVAIWQRELAAASVTELSGMATALMRVTRLIDSAAGPSLGYDLDAVRFEDVVQGRTTLLISLDSRRYPSLSRIIGGWALVALQRACNAVPKGASCLIVVDEVGQLGKQARHLAPLLALARSRGVGVVCASHGPTQLEASVHGLANLVLQETAWTVVLAQGDPDDADQLSRLFPLVEPHQERGQVIDRVSLGKVATGTPTVTRDNLMWLSVGDCYYRVRPVDGLYGQWGHARIAMPYVVEVNVRVLEQGLAEEPEDEVSDLTVGVPTATEEEDKELVYSHVRVKDGYRWWRGNFDKDGYPRCWIPRLKRYVAAHKWIAAWEQGEIPRGHSVDHECGLKDCLDHLKAKSALEQARNRDARKRGEIPTGHVGTGSAVASGSGDPWGEGAVVGVAASDG